MIRLRRWPTDYGRGPMRWVLVWVSGEHQFEAMERNCTLVEALRHPVKAYRWLRHGVESAP